MSDTLQARSPVTIEPEAIHGAQRLAARPTNEEELTQLVGHLRTAREAGEIAGAALVGRGSKIARLHPSYLSTGEAAESAAPRIWIDMTALVPTGGTGIIEYVPGDGTLTAQAGADLGTLRAAVAEGGHRITPAAPAGSLTHSTTLGGLLASGESSIDRVAHGPTRHHVLGMRIQDASGRGPTKSGGRLVKNVTGFDLHRLHAGGRGTLGAILEASLRLVPIPEAEVLLVSAPCASAAEACRQALGLRAAAGIQQRALFVANRRVHLLLAGRERQVDVEVAAARAAMDVAGCVEDGDVLEQATRRADRSARLSIGTAPSKTVAALKALESSGACDARDLYVEPDAALIEIHGRDLDASSIEAILSVLDAASYHVRLADPSGAGALAGGTAAWRTALRDRHPVPSSIALWTKRLQASFDPSGLFHSPDFPMDAAPLTGDRVAAHGDPAR